MLKIIRLQDKETPEPFMPKRLSDAEVDERWSFIGRKRINAGSGMRLLRRPSRSLAGSWDDARISRKTRLLDSLAERSVIRFYSDDWESYQKLIPSYRYWIDKMVAQHIDRKSLNFRTHLKRLQRRTTCFSKSKEMHQAVIKLYLNHSNAGHPIF